MGENEQNETNPVDDQETSEAERSDEERDAAPRRPEKAHGTSVAPVDDDVIIK